MKRVVLAMLVTAMVPLTAAAQDAATPAASGTDTSASAPAEAAQPAATPRPAKRRGSMVGYVEDASIGP
jgi:hypothetical protein